MLKLAAVPLAASALILTACGGSATSAGSIGSSQGATRGASTGPLPIRPATKADASGTWVQTYASSVDLLQLVEGKAGALSGSLTEVQLPSTSSDPLQTTSFSFVGTLANGNLSLTINEGLGSTLTWTGTFANGQIELTIPQQNGTLGTIDFSRSSAAEYSADVQTLQTQLVPTWRLCRSLDIASLCSAGERGMI